MSDLPPRVYTQGAPPPDDTRPLEVATAGDPVLGMCTVHGDWGDNVGVRWPGSPKMCHACYEKFYKNAASAPGHPLGDIS